MPLDRLLDEMNGSGAVKKFGATVAIGLAICAWSVSEAKELLDPATTPIPMYVRPLVIPPAMPVTRTVLDRGMGPVDYYEIAVRQFEQEVRPAHRSISSTRLRMSPSGAVCPAWTSRPRIPPPPAR
jgi:hypothetical protein